MKTLLLSGMIGIWATGVIAHSPLDETTPAHEAIVADVPAEVEMDFKGDIRLTRVVMTHAGKHSVDMELGSQTEFGQGFAMPLENMGSGEYVIEWRGLGADGHAMNGSFSFIVE